MHTWEYIHTVDRLLDAHILSKYYQAEQFMAQLMFLAFFSISRSHANTSAIYTGMISSDAESFSSPNFKIFRMRSIKQPIVVQIWLFSRQQFRK